MAIGQQQPVVSHDDGERLRADQLIVLDDHVLQDRRAVPLAQHPDRLAIRSGHGAGEVQIWLAVDR